MINDRRRGADQIEVVFTFQSFLHNIHMQKAQKAAAETEAERLRGLRLIMQRCVVELKLVKGVAQILLSFCCGVGYIWGLIEGILILCGNINQDANGNPLGD